MANERELENYKFLYHLWLYSGVAVSLISFVVMLIAIRNNAAVAWVFVIGAPLIVFGVATYYWFRFRKVFVAHEVAKGSTERAAKNKFDDTYASSGD